MRVRLLPRTLAVRVAALLIPALMLLQLAGLLAIAADSAELQHLGQAREIANGAISLYRTVVLTPQADRRRLLAEMDFPRGFMAELSDEPPNSLTMTPAPVARLLRADMSLVPLPPGLRPRQVVMLGGFGQRQVVIGVRLPEGNWVNVRAAAPPQHLWSGRNFGPALLAMAVLTSLLVGWAVWRMGRPLAALAAAADRLGRDVNAPPLPMGGPVEQRRAAAAFNLMAGRIRRFVQDRTFVISAIGHDLRTPITRLKLRAEFIEEEEMRRRLLGDIEDLEQMVNATMAFGRDVASSEPMVALDLAVLVRTVLDEAGDARPDYVEKLSYQGPEHLTVQSRSMSMKRALANLVGNAVNYGGGARVRLEPAACRDPAVPESRSIRILVEDDGPGIPPDELDRVFEPFHRSEQSRNRETGGVGLGLPIARNILRAHGGDVTLANRAEGGAVATVTLPV